MTPPRLTVEVVDVTSGYAVGYVVMPPDAAEAYPDAVAVRVTAEHARYLRRELAAHGGMPPVLVADPADLDRFRRLHAARYRTWYAVGLPALRVAARVLPLHYAERLAERYRRLGRYHVGTGVVPCPVEGYLTDLADRVTDAEGAVRAVVARRARRALARVDRAAAIADPREVNR
jgi:hypothetical protein